MDKKENKKGKQEKTLDKVTGNSKDEKINDQTISNILDKKEEAKKEKLKKEESKRKLNLKNERLKTLDRVLKFRDFLNCSFEPIIEDCEIVVAFLDVRGFTNYCKKLQQEMQDRKIQNFLKQYNKVFNEGLMNWFTTHVDPEYDKVENDLLLISELVIPSMYKNLGDGIMMVWEIPSKIPNSIQGLLTQNILYILDEIIRRFYYHFRDLTGVEGDAYSSEVLNLEMGCGAAKGHAWKLNYGNRIDYAGSIINLASRLESYARPSGIVCQYDTSPWLFNQLVENDGGEIVSIESIKGYDTKIIAWINSDVDEKSEHFKIESVNKDSKHKS